MVSIEILSKYSLILERVGTSIVATYGPYERKYACDMVEKLNNVASNTESDKIPIFSCADVASLSIKDRLADLTLSDLKV